MTMKAQLLYLFIILFLSACSTSHIPEKQFEKQKEIYDASTKTIIDRGGGWTIDKNLANITSKDLDQNGYVTMVAWKSGQAADNYYAKAGERDTLDSKYLTWVTKKSQLLEFASSHNLGKLRGAKLALRLEQLLGLPPNADTTRKFMELMVKADDLFRPCRDPEITDQECALEMPDGAYTSLAKNYQPVYEYLIESTKGFPWTRLGYTWDWNSRNKSHFGLSEYVIRQNAIVVIVEKERTEAWLNIHLK